MMKNKKEIPSVRPQLRLTSCHPVQRGNPNQIFPNSTKTLVSLRRIKSVTSRLFKIREQLAVPSPGALFD